MFSFSNHYTSWLQYCGNLTGFVPIPSGQLSLQVLKDFSLEYLSAPYEGEDPFPSLSGFHDYEPQLEFDDAELLERKLEDEDLDGE